MQGNLLSRTRTQAGLVLSPGLFAAVEQAATAFARLDQALDNHPLRAAFLYRVRLDAVRRQATVDGHGIDPWHLAAIIEGLRLRMDPSLNVIERGNLFEAARTAFGLHQWITAPDYDQEGQVQDAERHLEAASQPAALLGAAIQAHSWLQAARPRAPLRAGLTRFWMSRHLLHLPVPLTGARALSGEAPSDPADWIVAFLEALADEAKDSHQLLIDLERAWLFARSRATGRRRNSRASTAVDVLAAAPLLSATTLARTIGMSIKSATALLAQFVTQDLAVEVTHRSARRLFGLSDMAPVRQVTTAPRRPIPGRGRGRGRPPLPVLDEVVESFAPVVEMERFMRPLIDYTAIETAIADCERAIRDTRKRLDRLFG